MRKRKSVEQQVSELKAKTSDLAAMYRLMVDVQRNDLARAEKLRRLGLKATKQTTLVRRGDLCAHDGYLVGRNGIELLASFLNTLTTPFYKEPGKRERERLKRALRKLG